MTREDAYYRRILLLCGVWDDFDEWLDSYLEAEDPLSDIVLTLTDCRGDMKKAEYALHLFCLEAPFDEETVHERLRLYLRDGYQSGKMTKDAVMSLIFRFSQKIPETLFGNRCGVLSDYCVLAEERIVDMERFDRVLLQFLDGGEVDTDCFRERVVSQKQGRLFNRKNGSAEKERKRIWQRKKR